MKNICLIIALGILCDPANAKKSNDWDKDWAGTAGNDNSCYDWSNCFDKCKIIKVPDDYEEYKTGQFEGKDVWKKVDICYVDGGTFCDATQRKSRFTKDTRTVKKGATIPNDCNWDAEPELYHIFMNSISSCDFFSCPTYFLALKSQSFTNT